MDFILSFLGTLSVASVVLTALWFLVPKGAAENTFKYAMGVFIIWIVVSTFKVTVSNPIKEIPAVSTHSVINNARALSDETAKYIVEDLLNKCNIKFKEVVIIMDNSDSSDISITKARIDFVNKEDFNLASEIIKKQTGIILVR